MPTECFECGHTSGHKNGCSRDPSRPRPRPPDPPRPKQGGRRICGSCGNPVGVPGTRHKNDCPEYLGYKRVLAAAAPPVVPFQDRTAAAPPVAPPKDQPEVMPESTSTPPAAAWENNQMGVPGAAALKILRGPFASRNVVRGLAKLDDDDLRWVLAALYRIVRGGNL